MSPILPKQRKMPQNTYIRSPSDDYEPDKLIRLGHIWSKPRDPGSFVCAPLPLPADMQINHTRKEGWSSTCRKEIRGNITFWIQLAMLPFRGGVDLVRSDAEYATYDTPALDTYLIEPTPDYVRASTDAALAAAPGLIRHRFRLRFYMVTGVQIARGGRGARGTPQSTASAHVGASVDLTTMTSGTVPVIPGARVEVEQSSGMRQAFDRAGDYVFTYRLREIIYRNGGVKTKQYSRGGEGESGSTEKDNHESEHELKDPELSANDVELKTGDRYEFVDDQGDECRIIMRL